MDENNKKGNAWMWVAVIAAIVAALTTVVVILLRMRAKKKRRLEQEAVDYMIGDFDENGECCYSCEFADDDDEDDK